MTEGQNIRTIEGLTLPSGAPTSHSYWTWLQRMWSGSTPGRKTFRGAATRRGREEVAQFFAAISERLEVEQSARSNLLLEATR